MQAFTDFFPPRTKSCVDCQSRYFDCEFDQNDNEKTDGGLAAGNGAYNYGTVLHARITKLLNTLSPINRHSNVC